MISVIITTKDEHNTLGRAINAIIKSIERAQTKQLFEILVIGPDKKTQEIVEKYHNKKNIHIRYIKDKGQGKPQALNSAFKSAKGPPSPRLRRAGPSSSADSADYGGQGEICVMTDGDVYIDKDGIKNILRPFTDKKVGAVTGRPVSINQRKNLFGYWAHFLTHAAHQMRLKSKTFPCSGYLYAIRNIVNHIPENIFSEDAYITWIIRSRGYEIAYAPRAKVYVRYPNNLSDWLKQKIRSTGGYIQNTEIGIEKGKYKKSGLYKMRNFSSEVRQGLVLFVTYPKILKEFFWTILLYMARIFLWCMIVWKIKIKKQKLNVIWQRVESTKH